MIIIAIVLVIAYLASKGKSDPPPPSLFGKAFTQYQSLKRPGFVRPLDRT